MLVAVVVTFSQPADVVDHCVSALLDDGPVARVIVVDNSARTGFDLGDDERVEHVLADNGGFGAGANIGWRRAVNAGATHVLVLNDDVVLAGADVHRLVDEFFLDRSADAGGDPVGAVQPALVFAESSPLVVNSLGVAIGPDGAGTDVGDGTSVADLLGRPASDIELFSGGAVMFSAEFLAATGGFDERFFMYYEDVDLGYRGAAVGFRYRVVPSVLAIHERGASANDNTRFYQERNRLWTAVRWAEWSTIARAFWLSVRRLRHQPRALHARALLAGAAGTPGMLLHRVR